MIRTLFYQDRIVDPHRSAPVFEVDWAGLARFVSVPEMTKSGRLVAMLGVQQAARIWLALFVATWRLG